MYFADVNDLKTKSCRKKKSNILYFADSADTRRYRCKLPADFIIPRPHTHSKFNLGYEPGPYNKIIYRMWTAQVLNGPERDGRKRWPSTSAGRVRDQGADVSRLRRARACVHRPEYPPRNVKFIIVVAIKTY